ncbi:MAG: hypothetical protein ThorAB25_28330 [Candidatus Thorarchaeota archaeon AB_25]|nr:MAG: hypothetical protein ThorAB25_28330 [Candidatus Thorarchaeota archaeon AB_25]
MKSIHFRFPTKRQEFIWLKRRQEIPPSTIARELKVSRALVSKTQRIAEERIERILLHTAATNRINIEHISPRYGFAVGYCPANKSPTYIIYSPALGTQLWFSHGGDCGNCSEQAICEKTIHTLAHEWNLPLPKGTPATEAAEELFIAIMRRLKWSE